MSIFVVVLVAALICLLIISVVFNILLAIANEANQRVIQKNSRHIPPGMVDACQKEVIHELFH